MPISRTTFIALATVMAAAVMAAAATSATAAPRINCTTASSTFEMNDCAERDFSAADAKLNSVYQRSLAAVPDMAFEKPYDTKSWIAALRNSQRAWVAFRDAECKNHVAMFWTGGTGATVDILGCMTEKTRARTKDLIDHYIDR